jgi:N-acetylmuramic acid 6-phosphate etherase
VSGPPPTEQRNPASIDLDRMDSAAIVALMADADRAAVAAVDAVADAIAHVADLVASAFASGRTTAYLGAGTSGHLALLDAAELPATFGVAPEQFRAFIATSSVSGRAVVAQSEEDTGAVVAAMDAAGLGRGDVVIGLAASGTTPFVVAGLRHARGLGCVTVGIAGNPGTPVLESVDVPVLLDTGPEILTGSTRLKAGTAQKLVLNRISTTAMARAGRVVSNLMVDVRPGLPKLDDRAVRIVEALTGLDRDAAVALLTGSDWSVRAALDEWQRRGGTLRR